MSSSLLTGCAVESQGAVMPHACALYRHLRPAQKGWPNHRTFLSAGFSHLLSVLSGLHLTCSFINHYLSVLKPSRLNNDSSLQREEQHSGVAG